MCQTKLYFTINQQLHTAHNFPLKIPKSAYMSCHHIPRLLVSCSCASLAIPAKGCTLNSYFMLMFLVVKMLVDAWKEFLKVALCACKGGLQIGAPWFKLWALQLHPKERVCKPLCNKADKGEDKNLESGGLTSRENNSTHEKEGLKRKAKEGLSSWIKESGGGKRELPLYHPLMWLSRCSFAWLWLMCGIFLLTLMYVMDRTWIPLSYSASYNKFEGV